MVKRIFPIFGKSMIALIGVIVLSVFLYLRADKEKSAFDKVSGQVVYFEDAYLNLPARDKGKFRYLILNNYPKVFELFVGKDAGDFKPKFEQVDLLKKGDEVTVYFDDRMASDQDDPINRLAYFIDRGNEPIFIKGSWEKGLVYFMIGLSGVIMVVLIVLKRKGKIV